jgi:hypothetical protein
MNQEGGWMIIAEIFFRHFLILLDNCSKKYRMLDLSKRLVELCRRKISLNVMLLIEMKKFVD